MTKRTGRPSTSRHDRNYGWEWEKKRKAVLKRDHGLCQCAECKRTYRMLYASEVHHIVSRDEAKRRGWSEERTEDMDNLQAINADCHNSMVAT